MTLWAPSHGKRSRGIDQLTSDTGMEREELGTGERDVWKECSSEDATVGMYDICGKTFLLLKTYQDKKLHNDLTKPCESFLYLHIYLSQIDNCPSLKSFSLHIASINHNRKAFLRVKNYKYIIVMMQINLNFLLKLSIV